MRKFRAWDKKTRTMCEVAAINFDGTAEIYAPYLVARGKDDADIEWDLELRKFEDVILMQYTGLKDKKGKESYRNDIAQENGVKYQVCWDDMNAKYYLMSHSPVYSDEPMSFVAECKIIGDIHSNPELIEAEK